MGNKSFQLHIRHIGNLLCCYQSWHKPSIFSVCRCIRVGLELDIRFLWWIWVNICRTGDSCLRYAFGWWLVMVCTFHAISKSQCRICLARYENINMYFPQYENISSGNMWQKYQWGAVILHVFCVIQMILASVFSWLSLLPPHPLSFSFLFFFSPPLCWCLLGFQTAHSQSAHQVRYTHTHTHIHAPRHSTAPCSTAGRLRLSVRASPKTYPERR